MNNRLTNHLLDELETARDNSRQILNAMRQQNEAQQEREAAFASQAQYVSELQEEARELRTQLFGPDAGAVKSNPEATEPAEAQGKGGNVEDAYAEGWSQALAAMLELGETLDDAAMVSVADVRRSVEGLRK